MLLTLDQSAARLGKTARQIRYLVQQQKLPARKVGGRWLVDSDDLPLSAKQKQAMERKEEQLKSAVEDGLGLSKSRAARFSVRDLKAFQIGLPVYQQIAKRTYRSNPVRVWQA